MGSCNEVFNTVTNNFIEYANKSKHLSKFNFTKVNLNRQKQKDSFNCGVFVCYFYEILVNEIFDLFKYYIDINEYRKYILERLAKFSNIKVCCICKLLNKKEKFINLFKAQLKVLKCKHAYHIDCLNSETCKICE